MQWSISLSNTLHILPDQQALCGEIPGLILNQYLTSLLTCSHSSPLLLLNQCDFGKVQTQQTLCVCVCEFMHTQCACVSDCVFMRLLGGTHLSSSIHIGTLLDELSHHFHMALLRGQMESIEAILERKKREEEEWRLN